MFFLLAGSVGSPCTYIVPSGSWLFFGVAMLAILFWASLRPPPSSMDSFRPAGSKRSTRPKFSQTPPFDHPGLQQDRGRRRTRRTTSPAVFVRYARVDRSSGGLPRDVLRHSARPVEPRLSASPKPGVNTMVTPGWVEQCGPHVQRRPERFSLICNEYCGAGHQLMAAKVVVK